MTGFKTEVKIGGRNLDDIMRIPCVRGCVKTTVRGVFSFSFYPLEMAHPSQFLIAQTGDTLAEDINGKWHVFRKEKELM